MPYNPFTPYIPVTSITAANPEDISIESLTYYKTLPDRIKAREAYKEAQAKAAKKYLEYSEGRYRQLMLILRTDNKYHMELILAKKLARGPTERSKIQNEIRALLVVIRQTRLEKKSYAVDRVKAKKKIKKPPTDPMVYGGEPKMDAATKAAFQNS